ncbi:hypothetical protein ACEWY4_013561 [Coilia grayii]|uniref:Orange domain-containing protein n=1 Tax=Coilia grayii TaxID=363190 RepID=A0ABD1JWN8_9TELE
MGESSMWKLHTPHCLLQLSHWLLTVRNSNQPKTHTFTWRFGSINRGDEASADQIHSTEIYYSSSYGAYNHFYSRSPKGISESYPQVDILEMTICYLRQHLQQEKTPSCSSAASQGFSRCAEELNHFLSKDSLKTQSHAKLLTQFQTLQPHSNDWRREMLLFQLSSPVLGKKKIPSKTTPWRPW